MFHPRLRDLAAGWMPAAKMSGTLADMSWVADRQKVRSVPPVRGLGVHRREDVVLAGVLGLAGLVEVAVVVPGHPWVATLSVLAMTGAVTVRRMYPRTSLVLVLVALAVQSYLGVPVNAQLMTLPFIVVAAYSVGAHLDRRSSVIGLAAGAALSTVAIAVAGSGGSDFGFGLLLVTGPWIAGVLVRARQAAEAEAVAHAQARARQAADEERARIARELHDIVSHGLSAMVVQAAAAAELVDSAPDAARKAIHEVQTTGVAAMAEMHHLLTLTRGGEGAERSPQPVLDDVHELIEAEQAAGRPVSLTVKGTPRELPRGLALSIFRIVQESLTNVRKHASQSRCEVTITYAPECLEVGIVDDGAMPSGLNGPGFGIIGMGERARLYGGTLEARPRSPEGGWLVHGRFPLEHQVLES